MAQTNQVTLSIDEDGPLESPTRNNANLTRMESVSRTVQTSRNIAGLGDRLHNVFREIRPLVENARMGNSPRLSLPTWIPRTPASHIPEPGLTRPQSSIAHVNLGPNSQMYAVNDSNVYQRSQSQGLSHSTSHDSYLSENNQEVPEINISVNPANNNNINDAADVDSQSDDGSQGVVDLRSTLSSLIKYAPFYFIIFLKLMYDIREGLFTFVILIWVFIHSNSLVRREHGKQMHRSMSALLFEIIFCAASLVTVQILFGRDKLLQNVVMFPVYTEPMTLLELMWLIIMTDLIVKIVTVNVKIVVTMMPAAVLPFQKRGKVYLFVESVSQLYRSLLTIQPWIYYLLQAYEGSEKMVGMFLTSVYVIFKVIEVAIRLRLFKNATWTLLQSVNLGTKPTSEELLSAGDNCPICHDDYTTPVRLGCSHIFCELCIAAWLDREYTCPMCRAKVTDEPTWRDGSTTHDLQLY